MCMYLKKLKGIGGSVADHGTLQGNVLFCLRAMGLVGLELPNITYAQDQMVHIHICIKYACSLLNHKHLRRQCQSLLLTFDIQ